MIQATLRLFFHGLIAFVPSSADGTGTITAYTVDHHSHRPMLAFEVIGRTRCPQARQDGEKVCEERESGSGSWCVCNLAGFDMEFTQRTVGSGRRIGDRTGGPSGSGEAADPAWIVRLHSVNQAPVQLDWMTIPRLTTSSLSFNSITVRSCHLDQVGTASCSPTPSRDCRFSVHPLRFVDNNGNSLRTQAVAEYIVFELLFVAEPLTLVLSERRNPNNKIRINLECDTGTCPDLLMGNMVSTLQGRDDGSEHFLAYYNLARGNPARYRPTREGQPPSISVEDRQLHNCFGDPFRRRKVVIDLLLQKDREKFLRTCAQDRKQNLLEELDCAIFNAAETPIICPMAMFDP